MKRLLAALIVGLLSAMGGHAAEFEARTSQPAPALQARDLTGETKTLSDYRGKVLLLNYWASWCPPCLREMPSLERLREKTAGWPLDIVAVDSAETPEEVNAYLSRMKLGFRVLLDPDGSNTRRWKVFALPLGGRHRCDIGATSGPASVNIKEGDAGILRGPAQVVAREPRQRPHGMAGPQPERRSGDRLVTCHIERPRPASPSS